MNNQKGFSQGVIIGGVAVILIIAGVVWAIAANNNKMESDSSAADTMMENNNDAMSDDSSMTKDEGDNMMDDGSMEKDDSAMMEKSGEYKDYSAETVESEQAAGNKVVLFFHAPWCPFCKAADAAFKSRISEIPSDVVVLKTDYDSQTELKQKYGVTYQHTFVQIDNNENQVSKWNGGDIDNLRKYLK